jgi:hypothetical protein
VSVRLAVAAIALACALAVPLRLSADVWAYAAYGALLTHGADPWAHAYRAADVAPYADPLLAAALGAWDGSLPRDVYGPLFTLPSAALVALTRPFGPGGTVLAFRLLAALGLLACVALASRTRPRLAALLAFHPVVLWSAAEGHNDVFWLALVLASDRVRAAPARLGALVAAAAVKAIAVLPLAAAVVALPRRGALGVAPVRTRVLAAAAVFAALAIAYAPLLWSVVRHGVDHGAGPPRVSLAHAAELAAWSGSPVPLVAGVLLAVASLAAAARALRGGDGLAGLALLGWTALPAPEPWYAVWLVPVVALAGRTPASAALLVASFTGLAGYVQDLVAGTTLRDPALLGGMMVALYALPLLMALVQPAPSPQPNAAPPTPPPLSTPAASPAPQPVSTTTPVPAPPATPGPVSSPTPNPFTYVVAPQPGPSGAPRILEIALNDRVLHKGGMLLVRVTTSPDVTTLVARTLGHEIAIPLGSPGYFAGQQQLPSGIPFFLLGRDYQVEFVATTADGRTATYSLPIRLGR